MSRGNAPRDYQLGPFHYDARVLSVVSSYVNHQYELPLLWGIVDIEKDLERDEREMAAIIGARASDVHGLVRWSRLQGGRPVCTCGLVLRTAADLADPFGHLDQQRWRPAGCIITIRPDTPAFVAACQHCACKQSYDDVADAREWISAHRCPTPKPVHAGADDEVTYRRVGSDLDTVLRDNRSTRRSSHFHPRTD